MTDQSQSPRRRILRIVVFAILGLIVVALLVVITGPLIFIAGGGAQFPELSGPYDVGRVQLHVVDPNRDEIFTDEAGDVRELVVDLYYPADMPADAKPAPYVARDQVGPLIGLPAFVVAPIRLNAVEAAPVAVSDTPYPVLIFSPGLGGPPLYYTSLLEQVASHGYVVAAMYHPYSTEVTVFPDGRVAKLNVAGSDAMFIGTEEERKAATQRIIEVWAADASSVVDHLGTLNEADDRFVGAFDLERVGMFGHSFGGQVAAAAMSLDARIKAGINMDGTTLYQPVLDNGISGLFMFIYSSVEPPTEFPPGREMTTEEWVQRWEQRNRPPAIVENAEAVYSFELAGARHDTFGTDLALLQPMFWVIIPRDTVGEIDAGEALNTLTAYIDAFFDRHLNGLDTSLLDGASDAYPAMQPGPDLSEWQ